MKKKIPKDLVSRCIGHVTHINQRCFKCQVTPQNLLCPDYKKVNLHIYEVEKKPNRWYKRR